MPTYLKLLRRKLGVLTLLAACVFAAGWVRSFAIQDSISFPIGKSTLGAIGTIDQLFVWSIAYAMNHTTVPKFVDWTTAPFETLDSILSDPEGNLVWKFRWHGFAIVWLGDRARTWICPCWSITIPLTLVSAYLLLSKPRQSAPKKIAETTSETVA